MRGMSIIAALIGVAAAMLHIVTPHVRAGVDHRLWFGVAAGALVVFASALGLRRRWLRLRVGSLVSWRHAHNVFGSLALVLALLHADMNPGGALTTVLLGALFFVWVSGVVGSVIQATVPRLMTSRLGRETASGDPRAGIIGAWRRIHDLVVARCGPQPDEALVAAEARAGLSAPTTKEAKPEPGAAPLAEFYRTNVIELFASQRGNVGALATDAGAAISFDTLRASVDPRHHECIQEIERSIQDARAFKDEERLQRILTFWLLGHIPLGMLVLVLTLVHAAFALYY